MNKFLPRAILAVVAAAALAAQAQPVRAPSRGELLYSNHCIECHTTQMHWRELKQVRDWATLKEQVLRWQQIGQLAWDEADVDDVARYLNDMIYRFPPPPEQLGRN